MLGSEFFVVNHNGRRDQLWFAFTTTRIAFVLVVAFVMGRIGFAQLDSTKGPVVVATTSSRTVAVVRSRDVRNRGSGPSPIGNTTAITILTSFASGGGRLPSFRKVALMVQNCFDELGAHPYMGAMGASFAHSSLVLFVTVCVPAVVS